MLFYSSYLAAKYCFENNLCYSLNKGTDNLEVYIEAPIQGWAGIGFSNLTIGMKADVLLFWSYNNSVIVSPRLASAYSRPSTVSQNVAIINQTVTDTGFRVAFSRPLLATGGYSYSYGDYVLLAYTNTPISSSSASYAIGKHVNRTRWQPQESASAQSTDTPQGQNSNAEQLLNILHMFFLFANWI
eukprot:NODE_206_length_12919_cov_0.381357.p9 type:complete len:186 gc:universal NODE_206_length_12919_cov_0.381357:8240-8797(+)